MQKFPTDSLLIYQPNHINNTNNCLWLIMVAHALKIPLRFSYENRKNVQLFQFILASSW